VEDLDLEVDSDNRIIINRTDTINNSIANNNNLFNRKSVDVELNSHRRGRNQDLALAIVLNLRKYQISW
jgi:hypothetical protein